MSDRELLGLAAKAAGVDLNGGIDKHGAYEENWNPLTDDGDALRLAVKLRMDVDVTDYTNSKSGIFAMGTADKGAGVMQDVDVDGDIYAATRRAIVRAAAKNWKGNAMTLGPIEDTIAAQSTKEQS